jgi:hypothetical protein
VISDNRPVVIHLWDPTPQAQGSTTTTGIYVWNRSGHPTNVTGVRITTPQDQPGAPVFRVQTPLPLTLAASQVFLLAVIFSPVNPGPITGMVEVDCDDPVTPTVRVPLATSATSLGRHAELVVTPGALDLGTVLVGGTVGANVTLRNTGFYAAGFDSIAVILDAPAGEFAVPQVLPSQIIPGQSDTVYVSFNPTTRGTARGTLAIDMRSRSDLGTVDYRHRYTVSLSALTLRPIIFVAKGPQQTRLGAPLGGPLDRWPRRPPPGRLEPPPPRLEEPELTVLDFGAAAPGTGAASSFWIRNIGDAPLTVAGVAIVNQGSFGVTNVTIFPRTLVPGEEMEVPTSFLAYDVPGMRASGEFRIFSDDPLRPTATLVVTGRAAGPHLTDPSELLDLGVVPPAASSETVVFHSDGTDPVTIKGVSLAQGTDFAVSGVPALPAQLAPGTDLSLTVELIATARGQYQDQLRVAHDGRPGGSHVLLRARAT